MRTRWIIAIAGVAALAAVAVNSYMPWRAQDAPMPVVEESRRTPEADAKPAEGPLVACPADAKPANLDFTMKDAQNRNVKLSSFKGKVIMIDFWATWCEPCKVEIPWFVEFQNKYGPSGLQVIGISVDDSAEQLKPFIDKLKMNYVVLQGLGRDDVQDAFGPLVGVPITVMIDRKGRICGKHAGLTSKDIFEREIKALL
jgi:cytochrome c biogenesis protein CcmG/thiol:disulfide interchange protein DsbE